jgi:hypothetical protein
MGAITRDGVVVIGVAAWAAGRVARVRAWA